MRFVCDFSFVNDYVENFFSNDDRGSATVINSSISPHLKGTSLLIISCNTIEELYKIHSDRELVLETVFDLCEKSEIMIKDRKESLIKMAAISEIDDKETYVLANDAYIIKEINKTTHKAISITEALDLLKAKNMLYKLEVSPVQTSTTII